MAVAVSVCSAGKGGYTCNGVSVILTRPASGVRKSYGTAVNSELRSRSDPIRTKAS